MDIVAALWCKKRELQPEEPFGKQNPKSTHSDLPVERGEGRVNLQMEIISY